MKRRHGELNRIITIWHSSSLDAVVTKNLHRFGLNEYLTRPAGTPIREDSEYIMVHCLRFMGERRRLNDALNIGSRKLTVAEVKGRLYCSNHRNNHNVLQKGRPTHDLT